MPIRLAARAVLLHQDRLLIVNAYGAAHGSDLWCLPGGGAELHQSLPENLTREVHEETGLSIRVDSPCLVNEFHDPARDFHQVEIFFRCRLRQGVLRDDWQDPEGVVSKRRWVTRPELEALRFRPRSLPDIAWGTGGLAYDPLEAIVG